MPIFKGSDPVDKILAAARGVEETLKKAGIAVKLDARDNLSPGFKFNEWELAGVPLRIELGPKDLEKGSVCCVKRLNRAKSFVPAVARNALPRSPPAPTVATAVPKLLDELQTELLASARARRDAATFTIDSYDAFKEKLETSGGFLLAHWCGETACETAIHEETKATVRVITFDGPKESGTCVRCGKPSTRRVHFAKAY